MNVIADTAKCIGSGQCYLRAPEVFDQDEDDGTVILLDATPPVHLHDAVAEAVFSCPAQALTATD